MKTIPNLIKILMLTFLMVSCTMNTTKSISELQEEIRKTELDFASMAAKKGIAEAFVFYADENAVLMRNNKLIKGKMEISEYMHKTNYENITLEWTPDFIDVSKSGDLGYTYGKYQMKITKEDGTTDQSEGVFHTVWKLQKDGSWKYVWD